VEGSRTMKKRTRCGEPKATEPGLYEARRQLRVRLIAVLSRKESKSLRPLLCRLQKTKE